MTALAVAPAQTPGTTIGRNPFSLFLTDVWVLTKRSIARIRREPETLSDVTIQPVLFVLMFAYVFGGAIGGIGGGDNYHAYLISGMLGMTLAQTAPGHRGGDRQRHGDRAHRPVPVAADVPRRRADRAHDRRPAHPGDRRRRGGPGRARDRLAHPQRGRRRDRGVRARAAVRLRVHLGRRLPRDGAAQPGGRAADRVHHLPAADVHLQCLRADPEHARLAPAGGGVEPDVLARGRVPLAVRQPEPGRLGARLAGPAPRARRGLLVGRRCW